MGRKSFDYLVILSKIGRILPTLLVFNLFFGWIFFGFYYWLLIEIALVFILMFTFILFGKSLYANFFKKDPRANFMNEDVIDVEGGSLEDEVDESSDWHPPLSCPRCYSTNTRFIEPHYEMSVYKCENCGVRFETEE